MGSTKTTLLTLLAIFALPGWAGAAENEEQLEQARQAAFQNGFATIVESLNLGTFDLFVGSIDKSDFVDRIFGLRLIDQNIKKGFGEDMVVQFEGMIKNGFRDSADGIKATLLGVESRGDRGRAVVRYDLPELQFSYHEYDLVLNEDYQVVIVDWVDYLQGERYTEAMGTSLVMGLPSEQAARKLVDYQNIRESDLFQFTELLKAARDRRASRYVEILQGLSPELQRQRIVVLVTVQLAKTIRNRRFLRTALVKMAEHFPEEPLYSLMLLDYYVPSKKFEEAVAALQRSYAKFDFDDAAMESRLSAITLAMGNNADASAFADRAVTLEPGLELGWWSALRARVAIEDFAGAVEALQTLEQQHGHSLGPDALKGDKSFAPMLASVEFKSWVESRE